MFLRLPRPLFRAVFIVAVIVVFVLTMAPLPAQIDVVSNQDKFEHGFAFFALMLLGWAGWGGMLARDLATDPTSHNLFPFEIMIGVALALAYLGCLALVRLTRPKT